MKKKILLGTMLMMLALCSCGNTKKDSAPEATKETVATATEAPTAAPTEEPITTIPINQKHGVACADFITMRVNAAHKVQKITDDSMYYKPAKKSNSFVLVDVTIKNTSESMQDFDMGYFRLIDKDGNSYSPTRLATTDSADKYDFITIFGYMNEKEKKKGCLIFEVPKKVKYKTCKLYYYENGFDPTINFALK